MKKLLQYGLALTVSCTAFAAIAGPTEKDLAKSLKISFSKGNITNCNVACEPGEVPIHAVCLQNNTDKDYFFKSALNGWEDRMLFHLASKEEIKESICLPFAAMINSKADPIPMQLTYTEQKSSTPRNLNSKFLLNIEQNAGKFVFYGTPLAVKCEVGKECVPIS